LVTGAAGDIGRATAIRLAAAGARVVLADIADLDDCAAACAASNTSATPEVVRFDVTDEADVQRTFDDLTSRSVVADLLFNNAGYQGSFANIVDYDTDDFRRVLDINVTGVFVVLRCFARALVEAGRPGAVVNTASMAHGGAPNMAAYSASKAAVIALTKTAAKDLANASIRVNSVSPAFIGPGMMWDRQVALQAETPSQYFSDRVQDVAAQMIGSVPLRRYGSLDEVAAVVLFLLSDEASYITAFDVEVSGGAV
jgi:NAD(P)-dependent dehydrogenase (short-subunit alcohol dehydrogenase family)